MMGILIATASGTANGLSSSLLLQGKRILVTGGGRGIGRAIALICHQEGANVIITSRTQNELEETIRLASTNNHSDDDEEEEEEEKKNNTQSRLNQTTKAAMLLARRNSSSTTSDRAKASIGKTSVGPRRTGSATTNSRSSSISQIVDAVKVGSSSGIGSGSGRGSTINNDEGTNEINIIDTNSNRMEYYVCDVTNKDDVETMVRDICGFSNNDNNDNTSDTKNTKKGIDIIINNAGGGQVQKGPVGTLNASVDLESLFRLNVLSPELITSAVLKYDTYFTSGTSSHTTSSTTTQLEDNTNKMEDNNNNNNYNERQEQTQPQPQPQTQKVVLNISSKAGKVGIENYSYYVATKFALEGLTSCWAKELSTKNIRVHSLSPGMVNTKSFPKPDGKEGVRDSSSIKECLLYILTGQHSYHDSNNDNDNNDNNNCTNNNEGENNMMDYTGHYIHIDEYEKVIHGKGIANAYLAWKAIDEKKFEI